MQPRQRRRTVWSFGLSRVCGSPIRKTKEPVGTTCSRQAKSLVPKTRQASKSCVTTRTASSINRLRHPPEQLYQTQVRTQGESTAKIKSRFHALCARLEGVDPIARQVESVEIRHLAHTIPAIQPNACMRPSLSHLKGWTVRWPDRPNARKEPPSKLLSGRAAKGLGRLLNIVGWRAPVSVENVLAEVQEVPTITRLRSAPYLGSKHFVAAWSQVCRSGWVMEMVEACLVPSLTCCFVYCMSMYLSTCLSACRHPVSSTA